MSILIPAGQPGSVSVAPLFAAIVMCPAPPICRQRKHPARLTFMSWARIRPVGPAPMRSTFAPKGILSRSMPWTAHEAGSISVASSSVRLLILKHFENGLTRELGPGVPTYHLKYSAKPPSQVTPAEEKFSQ
jgi:hypothetical protein